MCAREKKQIKPSEMNIKSFSYLVAERDIDTNSRSERVDSQVCSLVYTTVFVSCTDEAMFSKMSFR